MSLWCFHKWRKAQIHTVLKNLILKLFFLVPSGGQSRMAQNLDPSTGQDQPPGSQVVAVGTPLLTGALPGTAHQGSVMVSLGETME